MPKSKLVQFLDILLLAQFQTVRFSNVIQNRNFLVWISDSNFCPKMERPLEMCLAFGHLGLNNTNRMFGFEPKNCKARMLEIGTCLNPKPHLFRSRRFPDFRRLDFSIPLKLDFRHQYILYIVLSPNLVT